MDEKFSEYKIQMVQELADIISFFSNQNKWEREKWVVKRLLSSLRISHDESELKQPPEREAVDVGFRGARFQVKELIQISYETGRRRHAEYKELLVKLRLQLDGRMYR